MHSEAVLYGEPFGRQLNRVVVTNTARIGPEVHLGPSRSRISRLAIVLVGA